MKCINHHDVDAVGVCVKCGKGLCIDCKRELGGKIYCHVCADVYSQLLPEEIHTDKNVLPSETRVPQRPTVMTANEAKRKIAGNILIAIGVAVGLLSLYMLIASFYAPDEEPMIYWAGAVVLAAISALIVIAGVAVRKPATDKKMSVMPLAALICGSFGIYGGPIAVLAIVLGTISLIQQKKNQSKGKQGEAIIGIVLGIIGVITWVLTYVHVFL
jgi:hypothetical protein